MKKEYAHTYGSLEREHWWFRARRIILRGMLNHCIPWRKDSQILEIGVGPGENLYSLYPEGVHLTGVEPDPDNAKIAGQRGPAPVYVGTIECLPEPVCSQKFDAICLFDVLEHIEDDERALATLHGLIVDSGWLVLSVPTYQWMWGQQDVINMHYRRYTKKELCRMINRNGFEVVRATYFNTFLFPLVALFRVIANFKRRQDKAGTDFKYTIGPLDNVLYGLFRMEWPLLKYISFPFGVSCLVFARKRSR